MHIADGILSPEVCLGTGVLSALALGCCCKRLDDTLSTRTVPLAGMTAALIFAGQMVNFPIGVPASGHLLGGVLAGAIVGPWAGCLAIALVLFVQVALFSDGGWLAYGANVLNMGVVGAIGGYGMYAWVRRQVGGQRGVVGGGVVAAWFSVLAASTLFCVEFWLSHPWGEFQLSKIFVLMASFHSLIGVGEALITGLILSAVVSQRPDLIHEPDAAAEGLVSGTGRFVATGCVAALAIAAFLSPFASEYADGLEKVAAQAHFEQLAQPSRSLWLDDYALPLAGGGESVGLWQKLSVSLAGVLGTTAVLGMSYAFGRAVRPRLAPEVDDAG
ncbi:MAG: energy-coupling factor ABC transporter permease [Planctomycetaceae bacterium]